MAKNIAVVGGGYWGKNLVRNFAELGALHTVCDVDAKALVEYKKTYPTIDTETDFKRLLQNDSITGVVLATPAVMHSQMAKQAMLAGKDVFVEKPLALRIEDGREMVELAEAKGKILMVGHLLEYHPAVVKLKELREKGELGKIQYIYSNRLSLGIIRTEENVLWSFSPHDIAVVLSLMNGEMPIEVSAHGGNYLNPDIADVTMITMSFKSGVNAHIFVSWLHPYKEQKMVVISDGKMAEFNDTVKDKLKLYKHEITWAGKKPLPHKGEPEIIPIAADEPLKLECQEFIDCIQTRKKPRTDGRKGLQVLEVLSLCQQSLETGGKVIQRMENSKDYYVHESSIIDQNVKIGKGTKIWHFCHVMPNATIGENCSLGQNTYVGNEVHIGDRVKIQNNVSVYDAVTLEDDVFCGPSCVFTNVLNPRAHVSRKHDYRQTIVKKGSSIGANATIVCGHNVGRYAFIGAGAVVTKNIPDHAMVYGNPARIKGWVCQCGIQLKGTDILKCPECGRQYKVENDVCTEIQAGKNK